MKKNYAICFLSAFTLAISAFQAHSQSVFQHAYGGNRYDEAYCVIHTSDDSYLTAGYTRSYGPSDDVYLVKTNTDGVLTWSKNINILGEDQAYSVIEDIDTAYYYAITGDANRMPDAGSSNYPTDVFLLFANANTGDPYQVKLFGSDDHNEHARSIAKTNDNAYIIVGYTDSVCGGCGNSDIYLIKTDLAGNLIWSEIIDINTGDDYGMKVIVRGDKYIITGYTVQSSNMTQAFLMETQSNGTVNWSKTYGGTADDYSYSVVYADSGYTLAGETYSYHSSTDPDAYVIRTNLNGVVQWKAHYDANSTNHLNGARDIIFYNHNYYLTGYVDWNSASFDMNLVKLNNNGLMLWQRAFGDEPDDMGFSIMNHNNRIVMAGLTYSFGGGMDDVYLVKTSLNGVLDCYNELLDTNTVYVDSSYTPNHFDTLEVDLAYDYDFSWDSPTDNDSICFFDSVANDTARYAQTTIGPDKDWITVYPNPSATGSVINIHLSDVYRNEVEIEIDDLLGNKLFLGTSALSQGSRDFTLRAVTLPPGIYLLRVKSGSFEQVKKLLITK